MNDFREFTIRHDVVLDEVRLERCERTRWGVAIHRVGVGVGVGVAWRGGGREPAGKKKGLVAEKQLAPLGEMVGVAGFELATPCTPCKCATRLRYTPKKAIIA